jgi:hypothetical protein
MIQQIGRIRCLISIADGYVGAGFILAAECELVSVVPVRLGFELTDEGGEIREARPE